MHQIQLQLVNFSLYQGKFYFMTTDQKFIKWFNNNGGVHVFWRRVLQQALRARSGGYILKYMYTITELPETTKF